MSVLAKNIWAEGIFLLPHHFQQQDRYFENLIRNSFLTGAPYSWGLKSFKIDHSALAIGKFSVIQCEGVMPDGTLFRAPSDTDPPPVRELTQKDRGSTIFICVAVGQTETTSAEVSDEGGDSLTRYQAREIQVRDTSDGNTGHRADIRVGQLNLRLMLEAERGRLQDVGERPETDDAIFVEDTPDGFLQDLGGFFFLPVARVHAVTDEHAVILDENFMPTCLDYRVSSQLTAFTHELEGLLRQRGEELATLVTGGVEGAVAEVANFLMLQVVNRYQPLVSHLTRTPDIHPEQLYRILVSLAGELATFTTRAKRPPRFAPYRHYDLTQSFPPIMASIRQSLSAVLPRTAISIPLGEPKYGIRVAEIKDRSLLVDAQLVLAVSADVRPDVLSRTFPDQAKIGAVEKIRELVHLALPGIDLQQLPVAPREIPYHRGNLYFNLVSHGENWAAVQQSRSLAFFVAGDFPNLAMELWAIRHGSDAKG